jgi:hypothetical protein
VMFLAVFETLALFEKHTGRRLCTGPHEAKEGRSALQAVLKIRSHIPNNLRNEIIKKSSFSQSNSGSRANLFGTGFAGRFAAKIYGELSNRRALLLPRPMRKEWGEGWLG